MGTYTLWKNNGHQNQGKKRKYPIILMARLTYMHFAHADCMSSEYVQKPLDLCMHYTKVKQMGTYIQEMQCATKFRDTVENMKLFC